MSELEILTLEVDENTTRADDYADANDVRLIRFHVYESSVRYQVTGAPLVSLASRKAGIRLSKTQVEELHRWLGDWLAKS